MKLLTLNFLTCAIKTCKSSPASFPLHPRDAELEQTETDYDGGLFLKNVLGRLEWGAMGTIFHELGLPTPPDPTSSTETDDAVTEEQMKQLHTLLVETQIVSGKLVCGNCGHEYAVREGIANFLLPAHLV